MRPFSLEEAQAGKPVEYRNRPGVKVQFIAFNPLAKPERQVIFFAQHSSFYTDQGYAFRSVQGLISDRTLDDYDIVMVSEKKKYWMNVYRGINIHHPFLNSAFFPTEAAADENFNLFKGNPDYRSARVGDKAWPVEFES